MGETIGMAIAVLVIASFVLYIIVFVFTSLGGFMNEYREDERAKLQSQKENITKNNAFVKEKEVTAHKVRTQHTTPSVTETSFEITNIKESILVTETVYVD